jgi:hypothetical protein
MTDATEPAPMMMYQGQPYSMQSAAAALAAFDADADWVKAALGGDFEADIQGAAITSDRAGNTGTSTESFVGPTVSVASAVCTSPGPCAPASIGTSFVKTAVTANSAEVLAAAFTNAAISANGVDSVTADLNWLGTVRGRVGYLVTPNLLLYATGGLA